MGHGHLSHRVSGEQVCGNHNVSIIEVIGGHRLGRRMHALPLELLEVGNHKPRC